MLQFRTFPSSARRGGCAIKKSREASLARADGDERSECKRGSAQPVIVVFNLNKILWNLDHHPVRSIKDASRYFVEVAAIPSSGRRGKIPNMTEID